MPINAQPSGRRGTVGHAYSALNLRLVLAGFGLVVSTGLAVLCFRAGYPVPAWACVVLAAVAAVDLVVIQLRRRARHRASDDGHSLFE